MKSYNKDNNELLRRYELGTCSEEEKRWIEANYHDVASQGIDKHFDLTPSKIKEDVWLKIKQQTIQKKNKIVRLRTISAAASILILIGIAIGINMKNTDQTSKIEPMEVGAVQIESVRISPKDTEIAKRKALEKTAIPHLVLADGKIIPLVEFNNGIQIQEDGIYNAKGKQIESNHYQAEIHTLTTPKGYDCKFTLSDGTIVWLNAESSIRFPLVFGQQQREIELEGEAYFDVTHDAQRPFIVKSKNQSIKVLGTEFNIRAYPLEKVTKTTLIEGLVEIRSNQQIEILKPAQQLVLENNKIKKIEHLDTESVIAWKNGYFRFHGDLEEIMTDLARWYDVDLEYKIPKNFKIELEAALSKNKTIKEVSELIQDATGLKITLQGRRLIIMN